MNSFSPETEKMLKEIRLQQKRNRFIVIAITILVLMVAVGITLYTGRITNQAQTRQMAATDSLKIISTAFDSINVNLTRQDSIVHFLTRYLTDKHDSTLSQFYTDTLQQYYTAKNIALSEIIESRKLYRKNKPRSKTVVNFDDVKLNVNDLNETEAFVNATHYSDSLSPPQKIIYQIKLTNDYKVYFVRNLIPVTK